MKNVLIVALLVLLITGCTVDEPQAYDVVFDVDGGSSVLPQSILENETIKKPSDPKKEEFIFMYWYTENSSEPFDFTIQITSDITLHAKWREVLHYTISFETNGGTAINDVTAKEETLLDKPNDPEKDDYVFVRWYKDSELNTIFDFESDMVTQDITLYALWQEQALYDLYQTLSQDIDYEAMGFYYSFDIPISYTPWDYSENGSIDPFLGETIAYEEPGRTGDYSQIAPFWSYFDET
ncbi:MAG: InlB B-repeat-containing protein, partial [Acholeplasma sp.]